MTRIPRHDTALRHPADRSRQKYHSALEGRFHFKDVTVRTIVAVLLNDRSSFWRVVIEYPDKPSEGTIEESRELANWFLNPVGEGDVRYTRRDSQLIADRDTTSTEDSEARLWKEDREQKARKRRRRT